MNEVNLAVYNGVNVILYVLRIGGDDRAVIMVIGLLELISFVRNTGVEDPVYSLVDEPLYMAVGQLRRITLGLTGNRFNPKLVDFPCRGRG